MLKKMNFLSVVLVAVLVGGCNMEIKKYEPSFPQELLGIKVVITNLDTTGNSATGHIRVSFIKGSVRDVVRCHNGWSMTTIKDSRFRSEFLYGTIRTKFNFWTNKDWYITEIEF